MHLHSTACLVRHSLKAVAAPFVLFLNLAGPGWALPEVSVDSAKQLEGQPGAVKTLALTFRLNESISAQPTSVNYRLEPVTARAGEDYVERSGTVFFGFGVPEAVNLITLMADRAEEGSEQFRVILSNPIGCTLAPTTAGSGLQTIVDDDGMLLMHETGTGPNIVRKVSTLTSEVPTGSTLRTAVLVEDVGSPMSTLGDYNGDELADIFRLTATATQSTLQVISGVDGVTQLTPPVVLDMTGATLRTIAAGDVTGDGLDDLVELRSRNSDRLLTVVVREAPGMAERNWVSLGLANQNAAVLRLSDVNDDGRADIHLQGGGVLQVLNGPTLAQLLASGASGAIFGYGDITGDGRSDIMIDSIEPPYLDPRTGNVVNGGHNGAFWSAPFLSMPQQLPRFHDAVGNLGLPERGLVLNPTRMHLLYVVNSWRAEPVTQPGLFQVPRLGLMFGGSFHGNGHSGALGAPLLSGSVLPPNVTCLGVWPRPADSLDDRNGLVRNPSFEMNTNALPGYGAISAWRTNSLITTGVSTAAQSFADNSSIPDRKQVAFLQVDPSAGYPTASLSQQITRLTVGQRYWLQFRYNARDFHTGAGAVSLQARFGGATLHTVPSVTAVGNFAEYASVSVPFTATAGSGLLEFIATGTGGDATVLLDAVSLTARSTSDVLLTNPGFEATGRLQGVVYTVYPGQATQPVSGWTFQGQGGTNLSTYDPMADNGTDVEGEMVAFLQGDGSRLRQTVSGLTPGARYTLSYLVNARRSVVSPRPNPEPPTNYQILAGNETSPVLGQLPAGEGQPYFRNSFTFTANAATIELVFSVIAPGADQTLLLDDIRLAPAAPLETISLEIARGPAAGTVDLIWPASAPATLILQTSTSLTTGTWTTVDAVPSLSGGFRRVNQPASGAKRYFRLAQP